MRERTPSQRMRQVWGAVRRRAAPSTYGRPARVDQVGQRVLVNQWRRDLREGNPRPRWSEIGFGVYSSNDEDGILLYLFTAAGTTNRVVVDIGFMKAEGSNSANLLVNWAWTGILLEGDPKRVEAAQRWFRQHPSVPWAPHVIEGWITPETIDDVLIGAGVTGEIDLVSIDIDGFDLWVWEALTAVNPRVVVVEYAHAWGPHRSVSVPNDASFAGPLEDDRYCSASLPAFVNVGRRKGYRLVAVSERRFNAFFVRDDVAPDVFPEITAEAAFADPPMPEGRPTWSPDGLPGRWVEVPSE